MPSLSKLPGDISRKKLLNALAKVGFEINKSGGDGSHYKITWPNSGKSLTIPKKIPKQVLNIILKEIEEYSGVKWVEIKKHL